MFAWLYGLFRGGFAYSLKMYIYEKVRAKNFARAWSLAQGVMGAACILGMPVTSEGENKEKQQMAYR